MKLCWEATGGRSGVMCEGSLYRKEKIKGIKTVPNTIKVFVNIFDRALEISLLFHSEFGSTDSCYDLVK